MIRRRKKRLTDVHEIIIIMQMLACNKNNNVRIIHHSNRKKATMGLTFSLEKDGQFDQKLYDSYIASDDKIGDLTGKVVAITGTTSGSLGYYVAKAAVAKKAKLVLLLNRESSRSAKTEADVKEGAGEETTVKTIPTDLLSFESVKKAAAVISEISEKNGGLDVLCCNAGIMAMEDKRSVDGFDVQMQANHLSHYLLTKMCMSSLEKAAESRGEARIVFHSSSARYGEDLESKYFEKSDPGTLGGDTSDAKQMFLGHKGSWTRYHQSKLANSVFAMALHDKLQEKGSKVKALSCDPGWAHSNLQTNSMKKGTMGGGFARIGSWIGHSAADGSLGCAMACFSQEANSGDFYMPDKTGGMRGAPVKSILEGKPLKSGGEKESLSAENKRIIMDCSEKAFGFNSTL